MLDMLDMLDRRSRKPLVGLYVRFKKVINRVLNSCSRAIAA